MGKFCGLTIDRAGNTTVLFAGGLTMLMATAGLAVDAGTFFVHKRDLQGVADAAALAAAGDVRAARQGAGRAIEINGADRVAIESVTAGAYDPDPAKSADARFDTSGSNTNAVRVALSHEVPTFFGKFLTGRSSTTITAISTAARIDLAAFSLGSRLASIQGGLPNALLSGLVGAELGLSAMDYQALAATKIDVLRFTEALRTTAQLDAASFGELLAAEVTLPQMVNALAVASPDAAAAAMLRRVAALLPSNRLAGSRLIDLGPLSANVRSDPASAIEVDAYSLLRTMFEIGGQQHYVESAVDLGVPGIASSRLMLAIGDRPRNSPWMAVGAKGEVTVRTTQTRFYLDSNVSVSGVGSVRVPIFIELAQAQATLADVSCAGGRAKASATLAVTPSVGEIALADFDSGDFRNLGSVPRLRPATLLQSPLTSVTAFSDVKLGGIAPKQVAFSASDIAAGRVKTVSTNDIAQGVVTSLFSGMSVNVAGLGPLVSASALGVALRPAAGQLDLLADQVTSLAGVRVGQADVRVNGVRCGTPMLVG